MAIQDIATLRNLVTDVVKVKQNTDPTKTQGIRLRQLLSDILDTVQDLVNQLGLSVLSEMEDNETVQDAWILQVQNTLNNFIAQMPPINTITVNSQLPNFSQFATKLELFSKQYSDLIGKPDLSVLALKTEIPTVPTYDLSIYALKSEAFSKSYTDLTNKPTLITTYAQLPDKPVLFSGDYTTLTNKPTIPDAQVNPDWGAVSGLGQILNKPTLFSGSYSALSGRPTTFAPSAHTHTIANVTGLQTLLDTIPKVYTPTGVVTQTIKKWTTIVVPTTASGFTVDISSAGFTVLLGVQAQAERNTAVASDVVQVGLKTKSITSLSFNLTQTNTAVVSIGGINVLSGLPLIFATSLSTILLHVEVIGY